MLVDLSVLNLKLRKRPNVEPFRMLISEAKGRHVPRSIQSRRAAMSTTAEPIGVMGSDWKSVVSLFGQVQLGQFGQVSWTSLLGHRTPSWMRTWTSTGTSSLVTDLAHGGPLNREGRQLIGPLRSHWPLSLTSIDASLDCAHLGPARRHGISGLHGKSFVLN